VGVGEMEEFGVLLHVTKLGKMEFVGMLLELAWKRENGVGAFRFF
jgi:hypothetical protein